MANAIRDEALDHVAEVKEVGQALCGDVGV
jgi:hypothetical protein